MKQFRLQYTDGRTTTVSGKSALDVIKQYDLCTRENVKTKITELTEAETVKQSGRY